MKLYYDKRSKDPTYFIQQGFRIGKKTSTRNVKRIGKHSELLAITDDPLAYAKEQVAKFNEEFKNSKVSIDVIINFEEKIKSSKDVVSASILRNIGYFYLQQIYHDLRIGSFFKEIAKNRKFNFDPNLVNRFLVIARILDPGSKRYTQKHLSDYYEEPAFDHHHILRTMDLMEANYDSFIRYLYEQSESVVKRNKSVYYYDCTNFYFEIESPDEDYVDEVTGEIIPGLRKYGVSKEHRPNPIVEMGLFMDGDGIPMSMCIVPGNQSEQSTAIPMEKELIKMLRGKPFIYCADAGLASYHIRTFNAMGGRAFIITQSIKKLSSALQTAVFNDCDYRLLSTGEPIAIEHLMKFDRKAKENLPLYLDKAFKVVSADNLIDLGLYEEKHYKNGKTKKVKVKGTLKQSLIITFSRKTREYQRYIRNRQIERAKKLLNNIDPETYKKGPHDVTRFIKRASNRKSGETATDQYFLDEDLIKKEEKYDGFYAIATNLEIHDDSKLMRNDVAQILQISSQRFKIEDCFRLLKTNFSSRPVFHQLDKRIKAHFMICFTALLIFRILQKKLDLAGFHFPPDDIVKTLKNMQVANMEGFCYKATYTGSQILTSLNTIYPLSGLDHKYYLPKDLNKKFKIISV